MNTDRISGGLAGKILRVDLSRNTTITEDTEKYARRFIGGRAINSYILLNEIEPGTKWSDPENMLIFGVGCLVGTLAPGACRVSIDTKNVFNNGKGSANFGGHFGPELKYAGYDMIIFEGKSPEPVYLFINDDTVELRSAEKLWGMTTHETEDAIRDEIGMPWKGDMFRIASIGPAGEKLSKAACIINDKARAAGRSGVGAVMGSKNLKAIAVKGTKAITLTDHG